MSGLSRADVRDALVEAIANVEGYDAQDVEMEIASRGGDRAYELESKTAEAVLAEVGEALGFTPVGPADLEPEQYSTLSVLIDLVEDAVGVAGRI